jgi:fumarylacetoacetase
MAASWVPSVTPSCDFSLANLPFGIIRRSVYSEPRVAIAIGSHALDLQVLALHPNFETHFPSFRRLSTDVFSQPTLNAFAALGRPVHREVRKGLRELLSADTKYGYFLRDDEKFRKMALLPPGEFETLLPMAIGDYTDFYAGYHHAFAVGCMFRGPENALQPNYTHLPVGYHGRASSIYPSGKDVRRPVGQILPDPKAEPKQPVTAPCRRLDFELELGCFIAKPNEQPISVEEAEEYIFGYVLLNDWSARDIQTWEYVPLGPFNSKNFATTISPWVVLADALEPFRTAGIENKTTLQSYLKESRTDSVFDIQLEVEVKGECPTFSGLVMVR